MDVQMGADIVLERIRQLRSAGGTISKKRIKESDPELMKSALYYFPSWEHAVKNAEQL
jgi:hypothetical protein